MIEVAATAQIRTAFDAAHAERGQALVHILRWMFRTRNVPLSQPVLTELSR